MFFSTLVVRRMARRFSAEVALQRMWNTEESESEEENNSVSDGEYE